MTAYLPKKIRETLTTGQLAKLQKFESDLIYIETAITQKKNVIENGKNYIGYFQMRTHRKGLAILFNTKKALIKKIKNVPQMEIFD